MAKTLVKIFKQNFCQKCSECHDLSVEFFWGYACFEPIQNGQNFFDVRHVFGPYKMAKTLVKILKQKFCQKCSECSDLSVELFWGYTCF